MIYHPTQEVKVTLNVTEGISKETQPIQINRKKIWTEVHSKTYLNIEKWIVSGMTELREDSKAYDDVFSSFERRLSSLIIHSSQLGEETGEWLAWINSLFITMLIEGDFTKLISMNITLGLVEKANNGISDTSKLLFKEELLNSLSDGDIVNQLVSIGTMAMIDILSKGKEPKKEFVQTFWKLGYPSYLASSARVKTRSMRRKGKAKRKTNP